jgi:hypothetical protein
MRRRQFLAGATALAVATLAGCSAGDGPGDAETPSRTPTDGGTDTPTGTETPPPTDAPTRTTTPTRTPTADPSPGIENGGFERGLAGWTVGRDVPERPGGDGEPIESRAEPTAARTHAGSGAVRFFLEGAADDGTVWVQQPADLSAAETLSVSVYSERASFNETAQVAAYAGPIPESGLVEAEFDRSEQANGHEGWETFEYPVEADGPGLVAVGMNVVWETAVAHVYDDVALS